MTPAAAIAMARGLYPQITTAYASDALLEAWYPWALDLTGPAFGASRLLGVALLLAHAALRTEGGGGIPTGSGALASIGKRSLSASWAAPGHTPQSAADAELATTRAGLQWLALRATLPAMVPSVVVL